MYSKGMLVITGFLRLPVPLRALVATGALAALFFVAKPPDVHAESTQQWTQSLFEDFEEGTAENISLRSDGKLLLAPRFREIYDAPSSYLWALATDSKGNLFAAGGPEAKVFRVDSDGSSSTFFETSAVEIHALAVDASDNVYAATSPESKIYKIDPSGDHSVFFDPGVDYVWGMAFDSKGNLLLATGDGGKIYRITPNGEGEVFFDTGETHVRSIAIDEQDRLIVGTDPSGLIIRVSPNDEGEQSGFVLYQTAKKEVTAVVLASDGTIYAAGVGSRSAITPQPQAASPPPTNEPQSPTSPTGLVPGTAQQVTVQPATRGHAPVGVSTRVTGGSEIYRIGTDGDPATVWESRSDVVYALGFDREGRVIAGTGDRGRLIRVESEHMHSIVLTTASQQITALVAGSGGQVYTATSNIAKVFELGPGIETEGTYESETFDARIFSNWGRLEWNGTVEGEGRIAISTRSGNLDSPSRNWSEWSDPVTKAEGDETGSPPARFVQWRAMLSGPGTGVSPILDSVTLYYRPKNIAPVITQVEATPPNYRFADKSQNTPSPNLTLPPVGTSQRRSPSVTAKQGHTLLPAQGHVGVRWDAEDANDDTLVYQVEIRGEGEANWKMLEEKVEDSYLSWDSTSFADGMYRVRVTASDAPSNPVSEVKKDTSISEPFLIDNSAPAIHDLNASVAEGTIRVRFDVSDSATPLQSAEYSLDGGEWKRVMPTSTLFDSQKLSFDFQIEDAGEGEHTVAVRVSDRHENIATAKAIVR